MSTIAMKDFIRLQLKKAGITETDDMTKILESESFETEIPEFIAGPIQEKTYGFIQAINKPDIRNKILADRFDGIENNLQSVLKDHFNIDADKYNELRGDRNDRNFQTFLNDLVPELKKIVSSDKTSDNEDTKNKSEVIQNLENKIVELSRQYESEKSEMQKQFDQKFNGLRINNVLQNELSKYSLKESVSGFKSMVYKQAIENVQQKALLKFDENTGEVVPHNPKEPDLRLMNEKNEVLTIKDLLDNELSEFVAKSDPDKLKEPQIKTPVPKAKKAGRYVYGGNVVEKE